MRRMIRLIAAALEPLRPLARRLPEPLKRRLRVLVRGGSFRNMSGKTSSADYAARIAAETATFDDQEEVHDLPPIFHYWSNKWLRPQLERFGFSNPDEFYVLHIQHAIQERRESSAGPARVASIGSGNCDTEVRIAQQLVDKGVRDVVIECVDINGKMLARGRSLAEAAGVGDLIETTQGDFNDWQPNGRFDAVVANQSLHHVLNLEGLFEVIHGVLKPEGRFITSDMIGRNGHMRWPEAMSIIREYWQELPKSYRRNVQLNRHEDVYQNWDCSGAGFEGIRAQDILPLLMERFGFEFFLGYGNLIDPFIDRGFGPHFDPEKEWDRDFIDRVHQRDDAEIRAGTVKPTHMLAVMRKEPWKGACAHRANLTPEFCVRVGR